MTSLRRNINLLALCLAMHGNLFCACSFAATHGSSHTSVRPDLTSYLDSPERVLVILWLRGNPSPDIANETQAKFRPQLEANQQRIRSINLKYVTGARPEGRTEAERLAAAEMDAMTQTDRASVSQINQQSRDLKTAMRREIMAKLTAVVTPGLDEVAAAVNAAGGVVTHRLVSANAVGAFVPGTALAGLADHPRVDYIAEDRINSVHLNVSAPAIFANSFWSAGHTGGNWYNAIADTGVDTGHPALRDKDWWEHVDHSSARWRSDYDDQPNLVDDLEGHGTHVAGIASSDDTTYQGIAFGSTRSTNLKVSYLTKSGGGTGLTSDLYDGIDWGINNASFDILNYSSGSATSADDTDDSRFMDALVTDRAILTVIAAGNTGSGARTVEAPGIHYNGLCVANVNPNGSTTRADDSIASSSSRGPTNGGRKKPDISAPGTSIWSCSYTWRDQAEFVSKSGTSMAAPHVTGAATLLYDAGVHEPKAVKAILINTADDLGTTGWDAAYGWGYINLSTAYLRRTDWFEDAVEERGTGNDDYRLYRVSGVQVGDKATLCWNRNVVYDGARPPDTYNALNDLELDLFRQSDNYWEDSSGSDIDNVEQVVAATAGDIVLKVRARGTDFEPVAGQPYAIAGPPGIQPTDGPQVVGEAEQRTYTPPLGSVFSIRVRVRNNGDVTAHNTWHGITSLPSGVTYVSGDRYSNHGSVAAGGASGWSTVQLQVTSSGRKTVFIEAEHESYETAGSSSDGYFYINPGAADTTEPETIAEIRDGYSYLADGEELLENGGFEAGFSAWKRSGIGGTSINSTTVRSGEQSAQLGQLANGSISQTVAIPSATSVHLEFWRKVTAGGLGAECGLEIYDGSGALQFAPWTTNTSTPDFERGLFDLSIFQGQTIRLTFFSNKGAIGGAPVLLLDDIRVVADGRLYLYGGNYYLSARDDGGSGLWYTQARWDGGAWGGITTSVPASEGEHNIQFQSVDYSTNAGLVDHNVIVDPNDPISLLVIEPGDVTGGTDIVQNGDFENGTVAWATEGLAWTSSSEPHDGEASLKVGSSFGAGSAAQEVTILHSSGASVTLQFWYRLDNASARGVAGLQIRDTSDSVLADVLQASDETGWRKAVADLSAFRGNTVRLHFYSREAYSGFPPAYSAPPAFYVDDVRVIRDGTVWTSPANFQTIKGADAGSGIGSADYRINNGSWNTGFTFTLSGSGLKDVEYRGRDNLGNSEGANLAEIRLDSSPPSGSISIQQGAAYATRFPVRLDTTASDDVAVSEMRFQINGGAWTEWQRYESSVSYSPTEAIKDGAVTICAQFRDHVNNESGVVCDDIEYVTPVTVSIAEAKMLPVGSAVEIFPVIITGIWPTMNMFYIQERDRSAGIRVDSPNLPPVRDYRILVHGITRLIGDELHLDLTHMAPGPAVNQPKPLAMANGWIGGGQFGSQPAVPSGATGLNNAGLLVRTWGRVTAWDISTGTFFVSDGSLGSDGLRVGAVHIPAFLWPPLGSYVEITGASGVFSLPGTTEPFIQPRGPGDIIFL